MADGAVALKHGEVMRSNELLLEQVTLAEEILENGPGDGRGYRLAGVVLALHEELESGGIAPDAWRPMTKSTLPPPIPGVEDKWPDLDTLDAAWDEPPMEITEDDFEEVTQVLVRKKLELLMEDEEEEAEPTPRFFRRSILPFTW